MQGVLDHASLEVHRFDSIVKKSVSALVAQQQDDRALQVSTAEAVAAVMGEVMSSQRDMRTQEERHNELQQAVAAVHEHMKQQSAAHEAGTENLAERVSAIELSQAAMHDQHSLSPDAVQQFVEHAVEAAVNRRWESLKDCLDATVDRADAAARSTSSSSSQPLQLHGTPLFLNGMPIRLYDASASAAQHTTATTSEGSSTEGAHPGHFCPQ